MKVRKRERDKEKERKKKKKKISIKWEKKQEWEGWMTRDSLKHKTWVSSKMGKKNQMNKLLFHMDDTTMMRAWWDEEANLGL